MSLLFFSYNINLLNADYNDAAYNYLDRMERMWRDLNKMQSELLLRYKIESNIEHHPMCILSNEIYFLQEYFSHSHPQSDRKWHCPQNICFYLVKSQNPSKFLPKIYPMRVNVSCFLVTKIITNDGVKD